MNSALDFYGPGLFVEALRLADMSKSEWRKLAEDMWEAIDRNWAQHSYDSHRCAFCGEPNITRWDDHAGDCEARLLLARLEALLASSASE